jgi:hypothetical protein
VHTRSRIWKTFVDSDARRGRGENRFLCDLKQRAEVSATAFGTLPRKVASKFGCTITWVEHHRDSRNAARQPIF